MDGKLHSQGRAKNDKNSADNSSEASTTISTTPIPDGIREKRSSFFEKLSAEIRERRSVFVEKLYPDIDMDNAGPSIDDQVWDIHDMEILRREKRRVGRGGGGVGGRGGGRAGSRGNRARGGYVGGTGGSGSSGSSKPATPCGSNYTAFIVVGPILACGYIMEIFVLYILFDKYYKMGSKVCYVILISVLECLVFFACMAGLFHVSTWHDKDDRKLTAMITFIVSAVLYSLRSGAVIFWYGFRPSTKTTLAQAKKRQSIDTHAGRKMTSKTTLGQAKNDNRARY